MEISNTSKLLSGVVLITVPTIEYGGSFLLGMLRRAETGYVDNPLRHDLFRADYVGAIALAAGVLTLAVGLIRAGIQGVRDSALLTHP